MQKDTGERLQKIEKLASRNKIHKQHYKKFLRFKNSIDLRRELVEKQIDKYFNQIINIEIDEAKSKNRFNVNKLDISS